MKKILVPFLFVMAISISLYTYDRFFLPRTAYVNIKEVFNGFELKKDYEKKFSLSKTAREKIMDSLETELKILGKKIESENGKNQEEIHVFTVKRENYFEKKKIVEEDNIKQTRQYDSEIIQQINQYIKDYGKEKGYTYIYGSSGEGTLMYAKEKNDITKEVINYINERYKGI